MHSRTRAITSRCSPKSLPASLLGAADDMAKIGAVPSGLQKKIVSPSERYQPALDGVLRVFGALHVAQALGGDGADGRERVLDAVMQFFQNQLLQLVGRLALLGVDAGLGEQTQGIDFSLRQQQPKADILCLEKVVRRHLAFRRAVFLMTNDLKHR